MATEPEVIRRQMVDTRAALSHKLNSLERCVTDQVNNVKAAVGDAKTAVKGVFDLPQHVDRHPWTMVGGAAAVGFCLGQLLELRRSPFVAAMSQASASLTNGQADAHGRGTALIPATSAPRRGGWLSDLAHQFETEIDRLKRLAIGAGIGMVRDTIADSVSPEVGTELRGVIDSMTVKLGGEPVHGPVLAQNGTSGVGGHL